MRLVLTHQGGHFPSHGDSLRDGHSVLPWLEVLLETMLLGHLEKTVCILGSTVLEGRKPRAYYLWPQRNGHFWSAVKLVKNERKWDKINKMKQKQANLRKEKNSNIVSAPHSNHIWSQISLDFSYIWTKLFIFAVTVKNVQSKNALVMNMVFC